MPKEYGALKHKVPLEDDEPPKLEKAFTEFSDSITKPPTGAKSQLAIVQSDGSIVYKTIKGDATLAEDGALTVSQKDGEPATPSMRTLGTGAKQACAGNDSRLSDERVPKANSVDSSKIVNGTVADTDLASPNNAVWRTLVSGSAKGLPTTLAFIALSGELTTAPTTATGISGVYITPEDFEVTGKKTLLRVRFQLANANVVIKVKTKIRPFLYRATPEASGAYKLTEVATETFTNVVLEGTSTGLFGAGRAGNAELKEAGLYVVGFERTEGSSEGGSTNVFYQLQLSHG